MFTAPIKRAACEHRSCCVGSVMATEGWREVRDRNSLSATHVHCALPSLGEGIHKHYLGWTAPSHLSWALNACFLCVIIIKLQILFGNSIFNIATHVIVYTLYSLVSMGNWRLTLRYEQEWNCPHLRGMGCAVHPVLQGMLKQFWAALNIMNSNYQSC